MTNRGIGKKHPRFENRGLRTEARHRLHGGGFRIKSGITSREGSVAQTAARENRRAGFPGALDFFEDEFVHVGIGLDGVAFGEGAGEEFLGSSAYNGTLSGSTDIRSASLAEGWGSFLLDESGRGGYKE